MEPASPTADEDKYFMQCLTAKKEMLKKCFKKLGYEPIFEELATRTYPVGSENWQAEFWQGLLNACEPEGQGALLKLAWRNKHLLKLVGGGIGTVAGVGGVVAGGVLSATPVVGVPLIATGVVAGLLGVVSTVSGVKDIRDA